MARCVVVLAAVLQHRLPRPGAQVVDAPPRMRDAHDGHVELPCGHHRVQGGEDLFAREVAARAKEDEGIGVSRCSWPPADASIGRDVGQRNWASCSLGSRAGDRAATFEDALSFDSMRSTASGPTAFAGGENAARCRRSGRTPAGKHTPRPRPSPYVACDPGEVSVDRDCLEGAPHGHRHTYVPGTLRRSPQAGVSIWLDELSRDRIRDRRLAHDIAQRSVVGVTTNPSIFAKAVSGSDLYDPQIADLAARGVEVGEAVRTITATDVREACDVMRPVYDAPTASTGACRSRWIRAWRTTRRPRSPRPATCGGSSTDPTS